MVRKKPSEITVLQQLHLYNPSHTQKLFCSTQQDSEQMTKTQQKQYVRELLFQIQNACLWWDKRIGERTRSQASMCIQITEKQGWSPRSRQTCSLAQGTLVFT